MSHTPQLTATPSQSSSRPTLPIAVIITAHGPARHLEQALASIRDQTAIPTETVVVDDTSRDAETPRLLATAPDGRPFRSARGAAHAGPLGGGTWPLIRAAAPYLPTPVRGGLAAICARLRRAQHD